MNRRNFLRSSGLLGLPFFATPLSAGMTKMLESLVDPDSDRVLVLVQLIGGNDGLNTLVPLDQYANLMGVRSNIILPENSLLSLSGEDTQAFHPAMGGMRNLWDDGRLGMIQSVAYPNQNRSHFRSTDIWTSASSAEETVTTGWLGRHFQTDHADFPEGYPNDAYPAPFAIALGNQVSQTCQGVGVNFSMALTDPFNVTSLAAGGDTPLPDTPYGEELGFLRTSIAQTNAYGGHIQEQVELGNTIVEYPETRFAQALRNVATMISSGLQTKVYIVNEGGFDTHANQVINGDNTQGEHAELLQTVSDGLAAFHADLEALAIQERVISMTFSEFGRRIRSNASFGTDHGTAAPLFVMGDCVMPGILGQSPEISPDAGESDGVAMQYDFRDIYGSILQDWFGLAADDVSSVLGHNFVHLPILRVCGEPTSTEEAIVNMEAQVFPNPFANQVQISFESNGSHTQLDIFDPTGRRIRQVFSQSLNAGRHTFTVELNEVPAGAYFMRLQAGASVVSRRIVKR